MSRSYRHSTFIANTKAKSERKDKRIANHKLRKAVRIALKNSEDVIPDVREVSDIWNFAKDGKRYYKYSRRTKEFGRK